MTRSQQPLEPPWDGPQPKTPRGSPTCCAAKGPGRPDSWLSRKFAVVIVLCLIIWSFYVVVGRICAPAIQQQPLVAFSRSQGVGTMIGFVILWLLLVWSYLRIILTGPGFAKEQVNKADAPSPLAIPIQHGGTFRPTVETGSSDAPEMGPVVNAILPVMPPPAIVSTKKASKTAKKEYTEVQRPLPELKTGPRWCYHCEIYKPDRTHHCRHCGTCVLVFDHHCLWIGQCVGWANHKFFMVFNLWTSIFCAYVLILQILFLTKSSELDGQVIGLIAVTGMFLLFSSMMFASHVHLILTGRSTVESFDGRAQYEKEADLLNKEFGFCLREMEKRKVRKHWNELWGNVSSDARWRFGSRSELWREEMGSSWAGWIFGRPLGDGLHFRTNPRFGPNGEWLQRKDWPKELQQT